MDIGSILLTLSILILTILFVFRPFFTPNPKVAGLVNQVEEEKRTLEHQYSSLLAEKDRLLNALQELEIDHTMGKIPEDDYPVQRGELLSTGAMVLRKLDEMEELLQKNTTGESADVPAADGEFEKIQHLSKGEENPIEEMVAARRRLREEKSVGFCPRCEKVIQKSDIYCPRCGSKVSA